MRIYLDCCAYNRPYDDLSKKVMVQLEAQAKLHIQQSIRDGKYALVTSEMLLAEVHDCPFDVRRKGILDFIEENASVHVGAGNNEKVDQMARKIMATGIKYKDACHVASALIGDCKYLITTDKRLLKYRSDKVALVNPVQFLDEMEGNEYD